MTQQKVVSVLIVEIDSIVNLAWRLITKCSNSKIKMIMLVMILRLNFILAKSIREIKRNRALSRMDLYQFTGFFFNFQEIWWKFAGITVKVIPLGDLLADLTVERSACWAWRSICAGRRWMRKDCGGCGEF